MCAGLTSPSKCNTKPADAEVASEPEPRRTEVQENQAGAPAGGTQLGHRCSYSGTQLGTQLGLRCSCRWNPAGNPAGTQVPRSLPIEEVVNEPSRQ